MDELEALLGIATTTDSDTKALADRLRNKKRAADFFALSTIDEVSGLANTERDNVMDSAKTAGGLRKSMQEREQQKLLDEAGRADQLSRLELEQNRLDERARLQRENDLNIANAERQGGPGVLKYPMDYSNVTTGELAKYGQDEFGNMRRYGTNEPLNPAEWKEAMSQASLEANLGKLREDELDALKVGSALKSVDEVLQPYTTTGETPTPWGQIPGTGRFESKGGLIGETARLIGTEAADSSIGEQVYSVMESLANIKLREGAGLSQTVAEMEKLKKEFGKSILTDPIVALKALERIRAKYNEEISIMGQRNPQVLRAYEATLGEGTTPFYRNPAPALEFPEAPRESIVGALTKTRGQMGRQNRTREVDPLDAEIAALEAELAN